MPEVLRRVVVVGGGSGSFSVLSGLRNRVWCQSIVSMMDSGGDSGLLRDMFGVLPPGDVRRCLVALSTESELLRNLFSFRFEEEPFAGRNFGNLFILALTRALGSEAKAIDAMGRILKIHGEVLPVTYDHSHLHAECEDGAVIEGESAIDRRASVRPPGVPIRRVYLSPAARANPEALAAIGSAEAVVLAPGDMFTSTLPNLVVDGIADAIARTPAPLLYVVNLMTKHGETDGWSASRHVAEIAKYCKRVPDSVLAHRGGVPEPLLHGYESEHAAEVVVDEPAIRALGVSRVLRENVMSATSVVRHDPERTADALCRLIAEAFQRAGSTIPREK